MFFLLGTSTTHSTVLHMQPEPINSERPLYRTGQLLVSMALVFLR